MRHTARVMVAGLTLTLWGAACLEPGEPVLASRDTVHPRLLDSYPPLLLPDAGGALPEIPADAGVQLTFSEPMDLRSLRGGMLLFRALDPASPIPLRVVVEPPSDPLLRPQVQPDVDFLVEVAPESGSFQPGTGYRLELGTVLSDTEGNPLVAPVTLRFQTAAP